MADFMGKKSTLEGYRHIQRREVLNFMHNLYQQPEKFTDHVHLYVCDVHHCVSADKLILGLR